MSKQNKQVNPMVQIPVPTIRTPVQHTEGSPTGKLDYHPNKAPGVPLVDPMGPE